MTFPLLALIAGCASAPDAHLLSAPEEWFRVSLKVRKGGSEIPDARFAAIERRPVLFTFPYEEDGRDLRIELVLHPLRDAFPKPARQWVLVEARLAAGNETFDEPEAVVEEGSPARVSVDGPGGVSHSFEISILRTPSPVRR